MPDNAIVAIDSARSRVIDSSPLGEPVDFDVRGLGRRLPRTVRIRVETAVDCRYVGQSHELTVARPEAFPAEHERRNGHARPGAPVEVIAVRARASMPSPIAVTDLPLVPRGRVAGPAVVAEPDCTVWVPEGWRAEPGALGAWIIERT